MPISISGSGTITGITAGGLPDASIVTADIADGAITDAKVNASAAIADSKLSGTTCKAWCNFNGTTASPSTIRASYNVSSVTKNAGGDYTINFTTAMPDTNYCFAGSGGAGGANNAPIVAFNMDNQTKTTTAIRIYTAGTDYVARDCLQASLVVFR